ncbi:thiosulfate oxidation carrier complex protein SoxZ [Microbaculum marinum]|uniref:Thiosulfate oxidation carrier complex protein SoxZ n=1 Tax=Microbaculum marinum TaxID=1764581 RepID=A0AAW9RH86_9HYPH
MAESKPRVKVPKTAAKGEVITIKTLINHTMESGQRKDSDGNPIPRQIINMFTAEFNGSKVFEAEIEPAISANPYFEFTMRVPESGTIRFTWVDDDGSVYSEEQAIEVN